MSNLTRLMVLASCLVCALCQVATARGQTQLASDVLSGRLQLRNAVFGLVDKPGAVPCILVRIGSLRRDYERRGFYRIGLLPIVAVDDVRIEVLKPGRVETGLAQLHAWVNEGASDRFEFRRLDLLVCGVQTNRIAAGLARIAPNGCWELLGGVEFQGLGAPLRAPRARLQVSGPQAGRLVLEARPPRVINLFSSLEPITQSLKENP